MKTHIPDPIERTIAIGLTARGIAFIDNPAIGLDFHIPSLDVYIECKAYYSPRAIEQLTRASNVILIQGSAAAAAFCQLIGRP